MLGNPDAHKRDKAITRYIHQLMWEASFTEKKNLFGSILLRWPANVVSDILIPLFVAYGLQELVNQNYAQLQFNALVIGLLGVVYCILWGLGGILVCRAAARGCEYIQQKIFQNYLEKDYEFYDNAYLGALGAQANRLREAYNEYNQVFVLYAPRLLITIFVSVFVIGLHSFLLAALTMACMMFVLSYTLFSSRWRLRYRRHLSEVSSRLAGTIGDALSHGVTVKGFGRENYEVRQLSRALQPWKTAQYRAWLSSIPADIGRTLLAAITVAIMLLATGYLYKEGKIDLALVALVQLYVVKMIAATHDISALFKDYESTMGSVYQAVKTMLIEPTVLDPVAPQKLPSHLQPDVSFANVTFRYGSQAKRAAIKGFTLMLQPGERVGLVGYSGSGKTTLTKLLLRFMDVTKGAIAINDIDVRKLKQADLRSLIAYVPQEPLLFHRSIADNICYGRPGAKNADISSVARTAYVTEFARDLTDGLDTIVGERGVKLSGGQRQRVAIARALLKDAPILVLDEATSALDSRSEKYIQEALWKLMRGRTALVIAHRLSTIQRMDRIVVMDKGKIVQIGSHKELLQQAGIYKELWEHQSGGYIGVPTHSEE